MRLCLMLVFPGVKDACVVLVDVAMQDAWVLIDVRVFLIDARAAR